MSPKRFRVAFSFAGEKRDFVKQVADILVRRFGEAAILYDKFYEAEFANADLGMDLPELYHKESDLVVVVLCQNYAAKEWCGLEWRAIHALIKERKAEDVMLCRFDHATIKGLYSTAGFVELDEKTPAEAAKLIVARLKANGVDISKLKQTRRPAVPVSHAITTPNNLPRLASFFGRIEELKKIADALSPKTRTWGALIDGPGGIGKTSLAIRAAEISAAQFQRIFFLTSKGRELTAEGQKPLRDFVLPGYLAMLNEIARLLKQPDLAKQPEEERARLLIDALAPAQALLILDNLESLAKDDQNRLFEFLSQLPPGCKAIVTSRRRTDVDARIIRLARLDRDAALELIAELATDRPLLAKASADERGHLYEETGGNPLLLRWIAGQLGKGRCRTVAKALDFLRSAPEDNDPLEFIFGDLLETFTDSETAALAALTYFTREVEVKLIAELAGLTKTAAESALGDLSSRALVVPDEEEENFALAPMAADFLRKKRPEVISESGQRLEKRAYALILENGGNTHDRFPLLEANWQSVAPALPILLTGPNLRLQTACDRLGRFLNFMGHWDEWLSLSQLAEGRAVAMSDHYSAGVRALHAGWIHRFRGEANEILICADRAEEHWRVAKAGVRERAIAVHLRGIGHLQKANFPAALASFREAIDLHRSVLVESEDVAIVLNDLADTERLSDDFEAAQRNYREALRVAHHLSSKEGIATYTGNLALLALDMKNWREAEALAREALPVSESIGRQELVGSDCRRLAMALVRQGKAAEGLPYARRALNIITRLRSTELAAARVTLAECRAALLSGLHVGWTYNTTTLEGSTLTKAEVAEALAKPKAKIAKRPAEHVAAARAQQAAIQAVGRWLGEDRPFTKDDLFSLHTVLMQGSTVDSMKPIGDWKIEDNGTPVRLGGKSRWNDNYAAAAHTGALMETWLEEFNQRREGAGEPFADYLWLHATFVRIHPFADGNGRLARLLANVPLVASGQPVVDIPATARDRYLAALARWQFACGAPRPNALLYTKAGELKDFIALCKASQMKSKPAGARAARKKRSGR